MVENIYNYWNENGESAHANVLWDAFKSKMRGDYIARISFLQKEASKTRETLEERAARCEAEYIQSPNDNNYYSWQNTLRELFLHIVEQTKKSMLFTKQKIFEYGNKNGRLLAWLTKNQTAFTHIASIRNANGQLLSCPEDINAESMKFFREVYTSRAQFTPLELQEYLDAIPFPSLSEEHRNLLEGDFSLEEVQTAIGSLQSGKTPGADGLPTEFYSQNAEVLAPKMKALFSGLVETGALPESMEEAIIVLIPKPGKDSQECASFRPISLLNVDAKSLAKILANRLSSVISTLVHVDQTGFMPGKGTDINLRRLFLNLSFEHVTARSRVIASLDAEKAFDSVEGVVSLGGVTTLWVWPQIYTLAAATLQSPQSKGAY